MSVADLARGLKELAASEDAYRSAEGYYSGTTSEFFANRAIERALSGAGSSKFRMPLAAKAVDIPIDMIQVLSVTTDAGEAVTKVLRDRVWDRNDLDSDLVEVFRSAGKLGDFYVTIWPEATDDEADDETEGEAEVDGPTEYIEVFLNSPLVMRAIYSRENSRRCLFFVKVWEADETDETGKPRWRANLYYRDRIEQYISAKAAKGRPGEAKDFEVYGDGDDERGAGVIDNEWDTFPCFHFRQGSKPYGTPLHSRAFGTQDALTKLNTTHMSTVDFIGYPQRYALMDAESEDDSADDDFFEFETSGVANVTNPTGPVEVTRKKSKLKSGPGETWWLEGVKSVGQFDPPTSQPFIEGMKFQAKAMALLTDLPGSDFDLEGGGEVPSGESRRVARAGLRSKVMALIGQYRPVTESMLSLALEMIGYPGVTVSLSFAPLDTMSGKDDWETIETKIKNGVPLRDALSEAGYADEKIEEWYPKGTPAVALSQATLIAAFLASVGQATTLGTANAEDVRNMLGAFLSAVAPEPSRPPLDEADLDDPADEE